MLFDVERRWGNGNGLLVGLVGAAGVVAAAELREEEGVPADPANPLEAALLERSPKLGLPPKFLLDGRPVVGEVAELELVARDPNAVDDTGGAVVELDLAEGPPNGAWDEVPSAGRASAVERLDAVREESGRPIVPAVDGRVLLLFPLPHAGRSVGASFSFAASVPLVDDSCASVEAFAGRLFVG